MDNGKKRIVPTRYIRHYVLVVLAGCLMWLSIAVPGMADVHIVSETEGERLTTYYKGNRIASPTPDGGNMIVFCETEEVALISSPAQRQYWRGTIDDLQTALEGLMGGLTEALGEMPEGLGALFGDLFGSTSETVDVRISSDGETHIAGYPTTKYVVETNSGDGWTQFEEVWLSRDVMDTIQSEVGACFQISTSMMDGIASAVAAFPELEAVLSFDEYQALMETGYPMRQHQTLQIFGIASTTKTEVLEVNTAVITEDTFEIPSGYTRVESPVSLLDT